MTFPRFSPAILAAAVAAGSFMAEAPRVTAAEPVRLITLEEASLPPAAGEPGPTRNLTRGPAVDVVAPPAIKIVAPFRFAVRFKPRNGVPVDPASLRLTYRRQPAIDLTPRVKPLVTAEGIEIPAVVVPPGRHDIEIEVVDREGRTGRGLVTLTVDPPS